MGMGIKIKIRIKDEFPGRLARSSPFGERLEIGHFSGLESQPDSVPKPKGWTAKRTYPG